jgi:hypothetical protein
MYDIFYASKNKINVEAWLKIKDTYPTAQKIENVKSFNDLNSRAFTKMFWVIWDDLELTNNLNLVDYRATEWDSMYVHVFKNKDFFDGVCLFPKNKKISQREFDYRFFIDKKEIDVIASMPKQYKVYTPSTFQEYKDIADDMFWVVWPENEITDSSIFSLYFSHHNSYDRNENHCFKHIFRKEETYSNGIVLFSKNKTISQKEFQHRFLINKKEHLEVASKFKPYDIVFISYNEPNAEENYKNLLEKFPNAKRVDKIKGIHQAHIAAAKIASTEMFWVVDGDAIISDDFMFNYETSTYERDIVHVWRSRNPINNLVYGYGGVKLLPREKTINMDLSKPDMTTSISSNFKSLKEISNITAFNTDPFNTWKSAFRECCKLSSKVIDRQNETETNARLEVWCTSGKNKSYGDFAIDGAVAGTEYGNANRDNLEALKKINDFDWLKEQYEQRAKNICS